MSDFSFPKRERLSHKKTISLLFSRGRTVSAYPLYGRFILVPRLDHAIKIMISVPKSKFKRAVDRNLLKRRIRESYRLNRKTYLPDNRIHVSHTLCMVLNYTAKDILDFSEINRSVINCLQQIARSKYISKQ